MDRTYIVKARVKISSDQPHENYKPLPLTGLFLPKGKRKRHADISKQCKEHIISNLKKQSPELSFEVTSIKIDSYPCDFILKE